MFSGSMVALVTPMKSTGAIDQIAFENLIHWHLASGTQGFIINGTTGESSTLTLKEQLGLLACALEITNQKVPVIAGTGTNCTQTTLDRTKQAAKLGVSACLLVTPYYNRPTQTGLLAHYRQIADSVSVPQILYTVPTRTGTEFSKETVATLSTHPNIIGIKDASGDLEYLKTLMSMCDKDFKFYSGVDALNLAFLQKGAHGFISVTANVVPELLSDMFQAYQADNIAAAEEKAAQIIPLNTALFLETNPIPVKWALEKMGKIDNGIRLPLTNLSPSFYEKIENAMRSLGCFKN